MSAKNLDTHNRWRNKTVAFRVSPEENKQIDAAVRLSGLTKQDYIVSKLLDQEITVKPCPSVQAALREELREVAKQLNRLRKGENPSEHLLETCDILSEIILGLRNAPDTCEIDEEDRSFRNLRR